MGKKPLSVSSLQWLWVIETLASHEQVDIFLLKDLITEVMAVCKKLGQNARERIYLRCLEALFCRGNGITDDANPTVDSKTEFDPSESCEVVLLFILHKVSASELRRPELLKWNVQPFIAHKRACLPKCALQELKDTILDGTHPSAAYLKERSGLKSKSQFETRPPDGGGDSVAVPPRAAESSACDQVVAAKADLIPQPAENENNSLPTNATDSILLPHKRGQDDLAGENVMGQSNANLHSKAKRLKHDGFSSITSADQNSVSLPEKKLSHDSSQPSIGECDLAGEYEQVGLEGSMTISKDDHDNHVVSKRKDTTDIEHEEFQHNKLHSSHNTQMPQNMPRDESHHDISFDEANTDIEGWVKPSKSQHASPDGSQLKTAVGEANDHTEHWVEPTKSSGASDENKEMTAVDDDHSSQSKASNDKPSTQAHLQIFVDDAKDGTQHCCEEEMLTDRSEYDDEEDGTVEKQNFLHSQCTLNHDSLSIAGWTQQNLCMRCNKDGQLLVCSSSVCPLVIHEKCLGCPASFDNMGNFYCPFCAYSRAVSEYLEYKKKASLAKKELASFINAGMKHDPGRPKKKHREKQKKMLNKSANLVNVCEKDHVNEKMHSRANDGDIEQREARSSAPCETDNLLRTSGGLLTKDKQDMEETVKESLSRKGLVERKNQSQINNKHDDIEGQRLTEVGVQVEALEQQNSDPTEDPASVPNIDTGAPILKKKGLLSNRTIGKLSTEEKQDIEKTVKERSPRKGLAEQQNQSQINDEHDGIEGQRLTKVWVQAEALEQQINDSPEDPAPVPNIDAEVPGQKKKGLLRNRTSGKLSKEEKQDMEETVKERPPRKGLAEQQNQSQVNDKHDGVEGQILTRVGVQVESLEEQISDPHEDPVSAPNIDAGAPVLKKSLLRNRTSGRLSSEEKQNMEETVKESLSRKVLVEQQNQSQINDKHDGVEGQRLTKVGVQVEALEEQFSDPPPEDPVFAPNIDAGAPILKKKGLLSNRNSGRFFTEEKQGMEETVKERSSRKGLTEQQNQSQINDKHDGVKAQRLKKVVQVEAIKQQISDPPEDPVSAPNIDAGGTSGNESDKPSSSSFHMRSRGKHQQYTYPAIPQLRRKKVAWTPKEEEMLKMGVQKFSNDHEKNIPWRKILEFGDDVFQKGRTPVDLKDKWRNICKGNTR